MKLFLVVFLRDAWGELGAARFLAALTVSVGVLLSTSSAGGQELPWCHVLCQPADAALVHKKNFEALHAGRQTEQASATLDVYINELGCRMPADVVLQGDLLRQLGQSDAARRHYEQAIAAPLPMASPSADTPNELKQAIAQGARCAQIDTSAGNLDRVWSVLEKARRCTRVEAEHKALELGAERSEPERSDDETACAPEHFVRGKLSSSNVDVAEVSVDSQLLSETQQRALLSERGLPLRAGVHQIRVRYASADFPLEQTIRVPWDAPSAGASVHLDPPQLHSQPENLPERASTAFSKGLEAAQAGAHEVAARYFEGAYEVSPHAAALFNLAITELRLDHPHRAFVLLSALSKDKRERLIQRVSAERLAGLEKETGLLRARISLKQPAKLQLDGVALSPASPDSPRVLTPSEDAVTSDAGTYEVLLTRGTHTFRVTSETDTTVFEQSIEHSGQALVFETPEPALAIESSSISSDTLGYAGLALGGASLIGATVAFFLAKADSDAADEACPKRVNCDGQTEARIESMKTKARVTEGLAVSALVLGGTGAYFTWGTDF